MSLVPALGAANIASDVLFFDEAHVDQALQAINPVMLQREKLKLAKIPALQLPGFGPVGLLSDSET